VRFLRPINWRYPRMNGAERVTTTDIGLSQIRLPNPRHLGALRLVPKGDAARLKYVSSVSNLQGNMGVLFNQRMVTLVLRRCWMMEKISRTIAGARQPRWFIQKFRSTHQGAGDR